MQQGGGNGGGGPGTRGSGGEPAVLAGRAGGRAGAQVSLGRRAGRCGGVGGRRRRGLGVPAVGPLCLAQARCSVSASQTGPPWGPQVPSGHMWAPLWPLRWKACPPSGVPRFPREAPTPSESGFRKSLPAALQTHSLIKHHKSRTLQLVPQALFLSYLFPWAHTSLGSFPASLSAQLEPSPPANLPMCPILYKVLRATGHHGVL